MTQTGALGWDGCRPQGNLWEQGLQEHTSAHWFLTLHTQLFANESVPDHVGYAKVKITLINENDNRPIFSQPLYNVSLYENVTVGTSVLTVLVSPLSLEGQLSSGVNHREAPRRISPKECGQFGEGVPPSPQRLWCWCIRASGFFMMRLPWPGKQCGKGTTWENMKLGPGLVFCLVPERW